MRKIGAFFTVLLLLLGTAVLGGCGDTGDGEDTAKVLKIGNAPYDYETPAVEITKQIGAERGYDVQVVEGDVGFMFLSLTQGDIDAWPGIWLPSIHSTYHADFGDQYELGSAIFEQAPVGWVVPEYMEIDSIADLQGNEEAVNGKLVGFDPGSGMMLVSEDIIEGYALDLELIPGSQPTMMAEADYAIRNNEPILFLGWRPHTMFINYDLKMLEDPRDFWELDDFLWGIRPGLDQEAPDMYRFFNNFTMSIEETEDFLFANQEEGRDLEALAAEWIEENRTQIDAWLE